MPFVLKNARATFQCAMKYCFHNLIHIILVYLDDLTTRSPKWAQHIDDLQQVFLWCRKYKICLNPLKCVLCVPAGCLLGFIVSHKGITVDPLKVQAILDLPSPKTQHQVHSLKGKANFLCHFVPEYAKKSYRFIRLLRTKIPFVWDQQAQELFDALKQALAFAPLLSAPDFTWDFILYVSASENTIARV